MALYAVSAGATEVTTDVNQYHDLVTGVMTDQAVTLANDLIAGHGVKLGASGPVAGAPDIHSDGTNVYVETNGAGSIHLRPQGAGTDTDAAILSSAGQLSVPSLSTSGASTLASLTVTGATTLTGAATLTGGVAGALVATGGVQSNSHPVVEGTAAVTHVECIAAQSAGSVATGAETTVTLTFARAFASEPAYSISDGMTSAGNVYAIAHRLVSISATAITAAWKNGDTNPQTLSHLAITCVGV